MKSVAITSNPEAISAQNQPWKLAFVFCFLVLLCDGADIGILAFTLSSLKLEFGLTSVQAGALGSWSLIGMGIGGFLVVGPVIALDVCVLW